MENIWDEILCAVNKQNLLEMNNNNDIPFDSFKGDEKNYSYLSNFSNPFKADKCEKIEFVIEKDSFLGKIKIVFKATIRFCNKDTTGYQYVKAEDFPSLVKKVDEFINSL